VQSLSTIGSGGFLGMGLGSGVSKYDYLPEAHTDFAFAIFCQEHGFLGAMLIFFLLAVLLLYCIRIANKAADEFGQMLALGIMLLILGQGIANVAMVGGLLPVVGVPLPFISYGGSSLIVTMCAMGILLNVCDHSKDDNIEEQTESPPRERKKIESKPDLHLVK
jgi:cell division protein FtsW